MGAVFPNIPPSLAEMLRQAFDIDEFVETGTYLGDTTAWAAQRFERVLTVEACEPLFQQAMERFVATPNVTVRFGDSGAVLKDLVPKFDRAALFWLDAHYSGQGTA